MRGPAAQAPALGWCCSALRRRTWHAEREVPRGHFLASCCEAPGAASGMPARNSGPASHGTALAVVCGVRAAKGHGRQDLSHVSWQTCVADLLTDHTDNRITPTTDTSNRRAGGCAVPLDASQVKDQVRLDSGAEAGHAGCALRWPSTVEST